jgi:fido (protein-threonine AMPylation protein)
LLLLVQKKIKGELYEYELENMAEGIEKLNNTKKNHLDYLTWFAAHKMLLDNVWTFAGTKRGNELQNTDFNMPYDIDPSILSLEQNLKFWLENETFTKKEIITRFHEGILTIHPFKDGNGRWARILTSFICKREASKSHHGGVI